MKNWVEADLIRNKIKEKGWIVEDTKEGQRIKKINFKKNKLCIDINLIIFVDCEVCTFTYSLNLFNILN